MVTFLHFFRYEDVGVHVSYKHDILLSCLKIMETVQYTWKAMLGKNVIQYVIPVNI